MTTLLKLSSDPIQTDAQSIIYISRYEMNTIQMVAESIRQLRDRDVILCLVELQIELAFVLFICCPESHRNGQPVPSGC